MEEWPFKHIGPDGKIYLHNDNWEKFRKEIEKGEDHNWHHRRLFATLHTPKNSVAELMNKDPSDILSGYFWNPIKTANEDLFVAKGPFPAWRRTDTDPDALVDSWHVFMEDGHRRTGTERIVLLSTGHNFFPWPGYAEPEVFAYFRNKYWFVESLKDYGLGVNPPSEFEEKVRKRRLLFRDIDEKFQPEW